MITKNNLAALLNHFGFTKKGNVYKRDYPQGASIEVNFETQKITYAPLDDNFKEAEFPHKNKPAKGFIIHRDTTLNFSSKENFVCLVCVHLLLTKGYEPKHIVFEPAFKSGHVNKPSYGDILVFNKEYKPLVLIENKTYGAKFSEEWNNMLKDGGQLFSYLGPLVNQLGFCENIVLFAADYDEKDVVKKSHVIILKDNEKRIKELESPLTFSNTQGKYFEVWRDTYRSSFETKGLFEDDVDVYTIGKHKYTINDIRGLSHAEIRPIYHEFATILRNHAITDFEHSFYILIDLFLCKITDELNNPNDLQFYYKGITRDTPKEYCARLLNLYQLGKKQLFGVDVVNKNESDIKQIFEDKNRTLNGLFEGIKDLFEEIKFYNIKKFNFIDVENREDFEMNFKILIEITALIQDIKLSESETNHFFGDLFEGLLSKSVHQTEGQYFTPLPIVSFIIKSLPQFANSDKIKVLDYACGAGHFLTEFVKAYPKALAYGIEKSQPLSQVAKIATIINGSEESHIVFKDALSTMNTQEVRFQGFEMESFDCIIANPPYSVDGFLGTMTDTDRERFKLIDSVDKKSYGTNDKIQCFFVERAEHFLRANGLLGIVLPISILTNSNDSIFIKTRELLFANFNILAIANLNSRTFGSTGTNTIVLFAQKVKKNSEGLINSFIDKKEITSYTNYASIDKYVEKQGYNKKDYFAFMQDNILSKELEGHDYFVGYKKQFKIKAINKSIQKEWFKESAHYRSDLAERSKEYKALFSTFLNSEEYKDREMAEYRNQFILFVKRIEKDKLNLFIQIDNNRVAILQSPPEKVNNKSNKEQIVNFLGYDWSTRKSDEGIKYVTSKTIEESEDQPEDKKDAEVLAAINSIKYIKTPLYNPNDSWDNKKFAFAIRKHIYEHCKKFSFSNNDNIEDKLQMEFDGDMRELLSYSDLSDLINFSRTSFDKSIQMKSANKVMIESKYPFVKLEDRVMAKGGDTFSENFQGNHNSKDIPFFKVSDMNTPGNETIMSISNNYVNENILKNQINATIFKAGTIVFPKVGMAIYTNKKRILGREAAIDNNTMAISVNKPDEIMPEYLFKYFLSYVDLPSISSDSNPPSINAKNVLELTFPLPPFDIQEHIVEDCNKVDKKYSAIRSEIEKYRKLIQDIYYELDIKSRIGGTEYKLSDDDIFDISIGQRVLNTELNPRFEIPVYSANVFEPFGMIDKLLFDDFSKDSVIWGIDGDWMVNVIPSNQKYYPTDHCGVLRIKTKEIAPKYMAHLLEVEGAKAGFKRSYRASIDRIENIVVKVASLEEQLKAIKKIEEYETKIDIEKNKINDYPVLINNILKKWLT